MAWFREDVPFKRKLNQESCYEPVAHKQFISASMEALKARGVVGGWKKEWGEPRVVSPLKVVPKKGGKLRLILDLSWLNKYLMFPKFNTERFSYQNPAGVWLVNQLGQVRFELVPR